jgi:hypothetical protein
MPRKRTEMNAITYSKIDPEISDDKIPAKNIVREPNKALSNLTRLNKALIENDRFMLTSVFNPKYLPFF